MVLLCHGASLLSICSDVECHVVMAVSEFLNSLFEMCPYTTDEPFGTSPPTGLVLSEAKEQGVLLVYDTQVTNTAKLLQ